MPMTHTAGCAWSTLLMVQESNQIESVLRTGLFLLYGEQFQSFLWALRQAKMRTLKEQRSRNFETFTRDCLRSTKFRNWFVRTEKPPGKATRRKKPRLKPIPTRTQVLARSAIAHMVKLANSPNIWASRNKLVFNFGRVIVA